jgi:hypothetical protein
MLYLGVRRTRCETLGVMLQNCHTFWAETEWRWRAVSETVSGMAKNSSSEMSYRRRAHLNRTPAIHFTGGSLIHNMTQLVKHGPPLFTKNPTRRTWHHLGRAITRFIVRDNVITRRLGCHVLVVGWRMFTNCIIMIRPTPTKDGI